MPHVHRPILVLLVTFLSALAGASGAGAAPAPASTKATSSRPASVPKFQGAPLERAWLTLRRAGDRVLVDVKATGPRVASRRTGLDLYRDARGAGAVRELSAAQKQRLSATPLDRRDVRLQILGAAPGEEAPTAANRSGGEEASRTARTTSLQATTIDPSSVPAPNGRADGICNELFPTGPYTGNHVSNCDFWSMTVAQRTSGSRIVISAEYAINASRGCPTYCGEIPKVSIDVLDAKFGGVQAGARKVFIDPINRLPTEYGAWNDPNCVGCELTYARWRGSASLPASAGAVSQLHARTCYQSTQYYGSTLQPLGTAQFWYTYEDGVYNGSFYPAYRYTTDCYADASEPLFGLPNDAPVATVGDGSGPSPAERLGPGNAASPNVTKCSAGDPVDCATGNMYESATDLAIGGRGLGLVQTRTYNAQAPAQSSSGTMGYGWTAPYTDTIFVDAATQTATVLQADGSSVPFKRATDGTYSAQPWILASLKATTEGFTYTLPDQRTMSFSTAGRLVSVADEQGNTTTIGRDADGRVGEVVDPAGRKLLYAYDGDSRIKTVTDPIGRKVTYGYDARGNLTSVTKADGAVWRYDYDADHLLTSRTDPRGNTTTSVYDGQRRVVSQTDAMGRNRKWQYGTDADGRDQTTITEPNGSTTVKTFLNGQPTRIVRAQGTADETTQVLRYNAAGVKSRVTDENGNSTTLLYDEAGNLATVLAPSGTMRMAYDQRRHPTKVSTPSGMTQQLTYDERGNVLSATLRSPERTQEQQTAYTYDASGQLEKSTDPLGRATTYTYNAAGDRTSVATPLGHKTTFGFDGASRMTSQVSAKGNAAGGDPAAYRTTWTLDPENRPTSMTDPLGRITRTTYDAIGNPTSETDGEGRTTNYEYNKANEQTLVNDPASAKTRFAYDAMGTVVKRTDPNGNATTYENDLLERRISDTDAKGRTKRFSYDPAGNLTRSTDPAGRSVERTYDAANRLTRVEHSTGRPAPITVEYDEDSRQVKYGDVETSYDEFGRVATTSNGASGATTYTYDLADQLTSIGYPKTIVDDLLGTGLTVTHKHDEDGRTTEVATSRGHKATYAYDAEGLATTVTRPDNGVERRTYDAAGQLKTISDSTANGYAYAANHEYTAAGQNRVTDESSNQAGSKLQYSYDAASRLTSNGRGATYGYDPVGNQTSTATQGLGNRLLGDLAPALSLGSYDQVTQKFNEVNELVSATPASPLGTSSTFRYDPMGQRLARTSKTAGLSAGTTSYLWDQAGRLLNVDDSATNESSSYTYDDSGLRATQSKLQLLPNAWDRASSLPLQLSDGKALYVHGADGLPLLSYKTSLITSVYHHDAQGSTRAVTSTDGAPRARYSYDAYGELNGNVKTAAAANPFLYRGQYTDASTGLQYLRARYYDTSTGQFLSRDPLEEETGEAYIYAADDPVNQSDPTGLFSLRDVSNFAAGFGDTVSFGATSEVRKLLGSNDNVDFCSGAYGGGELAGLGAGTVTGGTGALRAGANALRRRGWVWRGGEWQNADRSVRVAPFGNEPFSSTMKNGKPNEWYRRAPHYHRRRPDLGQPGQGIGRHRPGQGSQHDRRFSDRF